MFKEHLVFILVPIAYTLISSPVVDQHPVATTDDETIEDVDLVGLDVDLVASYVVMDIPLRRTNRTCRPTILDDYIVYLQKHEYDVGDVSDLTTMSRKKVWSLVDFPNSCKPIG